MAPMLAGGAVRVKDDWTFETSGLFERRRFRVNAPPSGWFLKSVTHEGTDITDSGLDFKEGQQTGASKSSSRNGPPRLPAAYRTLRRDR